MEPLATWFDEAPGDLLPLPARLAAVYGPLRMPVRADRPHVFTNTGSGDLDLSSATFSSAAPSLVVTTEAGATRLAGRREVPVAVASPGREWIPLRAVLATAKLGPRALVLVESGPTSTTRFLEEGAVDEVFLTSAPVLIGRGGTTPALGLVEGRSFPPGARPLRLVSARRGGSFLFLRYATGGSSSVG